MAEEVLVKEALLAEEIAAGEELLKRLDQAKAGIIAAYWIYEPSAALWTLEFVSPQVESKGPLEFYALINELVSNHPKMPIWLGVHIIMVLGPNYSFFKSLRAALNPRRELCGIKLNQVVVGDMVVDMYIYRFPKNGAA